MVVGVRGWAPTDVGVGWKCVSLAGELTTTLFLEQLHHVSSLQCQDSVVSWGCEQCREEGFVTSSYSFPQHLCSANPLVFAKNTSSCDGMWQIESPVFIVRFFVRLKIIFHLGSSWVAKTLCMLRNCFFCQLFRPLFIHYNQNYCPTIIVPLHLHSGSGRACNMKSLCSSLRLDVVTTDSVV